MGCDEVKSPEPPKIDTSKLPAGVQFPRGQGEQGFSALSDAKAGISDALKGAENLIKENVQAVGEALNPQALGDKIGQAIGSIAGGIKDTVQSAVDGVNGLASQLSSFGTKSAESAKTASQGKLSFAGTAGKNKCEEEYIQKAARFNTGVKSKANAKANNLSEKEKRQMAEDPEKDKQVKEKIAAEVATETQEEVAQQAKTEDKEKRTTQDNLHSELLAVTPKQEKCDLNYLGYLLTQMSWYQSGLYLQLRRGRTVGESLQLLGEHPERFVDPPVTTITTMIDATVKIKTIAKLIKYLKTLWDENCEEFSPKPDDFFGVFGAPPRFDVYMQSIRPNVYGPNARVTTHDTNKWPGDKMLTEYFELWDHSSWMLQELSSTGVSKTISDKGLGSGPVGILSVIDYTASSVNTNWYDDVKSALGGSELQSAVTEYISRTQAEIHDKYNMEYSQGKYLIGFNNNVPQDVQVYEKNFLIEAQVNFSSYDVNSIKYISDSDELTKKALA